MTDRMVSVEALCARLNEYPIPTRIGITAVMKLIEEVATQGADGESLRPVAYEHAQLMKFYGIETTDALISAMERHIEKLQSKLPQYRDPVNQRVREG